MISFFRLKFHFIHFFLFIFTCSADLAQETIYLTWQGNPSTTMTIQWLTSAPLTLSAVAYRQKGENQEWKKATGEDFLLDPPTQTYIHRVELTNLQPQTEYLFKVLPCESEYQFLTAPQNLSEEIRFVVGGDMYHDHVQIMACTCKQAAQTNPLFALIGGDIAYAVKSISCPYQDVNCWIEWIKNWHATMITPRGNLIPVLAAIGNHDLLGQFDQTPKQAWIFSLLFPMPGKSIYNVLDFNSYLTLILLDSGHANPISGQQTKWLQETLDRRQHMTHRFAFYHVPAYPSIRDFNTKQSVAIRQFWVPLFENGGIQAVFEHHDHAYKRTHPLLKSCPHPQGIVYIGDGGWGVQQPRVNQHQKPYIAKFISTRHFIAVALTPTQQSFKCINDQGAILDSYVSHLKLAPVEAISLK